MHWLPAMVQAAALVHKHHREAWKFCIGDTWERHTFGSNSLGCFKSWGCFSMFLCCVSLLVFFGFRRHVVILGWVVLPIFIVNFSLNRICWIHYDMNYTFGCIWYPSYWGNMPMWNDVFVVQRRIFGRTLGPAPYRSRRERRTSPLWPVQTRTCRGFCCVPLLDKWCCWKAWENQTIQEYIAKKQLQSSGLVFLMATALSWRINLEYVRPFIDKILAWRPSCLVVNARMDCQT